MIAETFAAMPKLLWVALPLLVGVALVAWAVWRHGGLRRASLHVWSSLLLVAYLSATAGLGVFWVANQQLPVFDWHYLFGYATVLLALLHLGLNAPALWRHFRPRGRASGAAAAERERRPLLVALGVALAGLAGYGLGRRHRQEPIHLSWPQASNAVDARAPGDAAMAFVARYHALSSHSRTGVLARAPGVEWGDPPPAFLSRPGPTLALPAPTAEAAPASLAALATLLWHTAGISTWRGGLALRCAPSSGGLFATELYVAASAVDGLAPGLWHYRPAEHALARLGDAPAAANLGAPGEIPGTAAWIVATAVLRRTGHKYRDRCYRYVLADLGHALHNLQRVVQAQGGALHWMPGFDEALAARVLGVDEDEQAVLGLMAWQGRRGSVVDVVEADRGRWRAPPPPGPGVALGLTGAMHRATSLRRTDAGTSAASAPGPTGLPAAAPASAAAMPAATLLSQIARRRSQRRFDAAPLAQEALLASLRAADAGGPVRLPLQLRVVALHVQGLAVGVWRWEADRLHLERAADGMGSLRAAARAMALDQDVVGDAAAVVVVAVEHAALRADRFGPLRGYRHALLAAGCAGEAVYLEATAHGLAVCSVGAFHDDEAAALIGADPAASWVLHLVALGPAAA